MTLAEINRHYMHLEDFIDRLKKVQSKKALFNFAEGTRLTETDIKLWEIKHKQTIPDKIKRFYLILNGLTTINPNFSIVELDTLNIISSRIHFATFDNIAKVHFDISQLNQANEWTIVNDENNYIITFSISSFWSNKIWHWIDSGNRIWVKDWETQNI